jgi:hypothetical protein
MNRHCPTERHFSDDWRRRVDRLLTDKLPTCPNPKVKMDMPDDLEFHPLWREK